MKSPWKHTAITLVSSLAGAWLATRLPGFDPVVSTGAIAGIIGLVCHALSDTNGV